MVRDLSMEKILATKLHNGITIREYFRELLQTLWEKEESFSGKRPFGDSGWKNQIYGALSEDPYIKDETKQQLDRQIIAAIRYMCI